MITRLLGSLLLGVLNLSNIANMDHMTQSAVFNCFREFLLRLILYMCT